MPGVRPPARTAQGQTSELGTSRRHTVSLQFAIALVLASGCATESLDVGMPANAFRSTPAAEDSLQSVLLATDDLVDQPWMLALTDESLVLTDTRAPFVHMFDRRTGKRLRSFGNLGEGPGDFATGPTPLRWGSRGDTLWLVDGPRRRITGLRLGSSAPDSAGQVVGTYPVRQLRVVSMDGPVDGIFYGIVSDPQIGLTPIMLRTSPEVEVRSFEVVHSTDQRASSRYLSNAYAARVCVSPPEGRMVVVYTYAGRIDLYSLDDFESDSVQVPHPFRPHIAFSERAGESAFFGSSDSARTGYADCAVTSSGFYALYQGDLSIDERQQGAKFTELHSFNWNGELLRIAVLDHFSTTLAVTDDDSLLYTAHGFPTGSQVRVTQLRSMHR